MNSLPLIRVATVNQIRSCTSCHLRLTCPAPAPFRGPTPATIAVVGESPAPEPDPAGQLLNGLLVFAGFNLEDLFFCNVVSCRPPGGRSPRFDELEACRVNLRDQLAVANPRFVLVLGATALSVFRPDLRVTRDHGRGFLVPADDGRIYFPTFHPAAALRDETWRDEMTLDLVVFRAVTLAADPMEAAGLRLAAS